MVSCGAPRCTNRAAKNPNIITLVKEIAMISQLYRSIFRTLAYLMPMTYPKPYQIFKGTLMQILKFPNMF